jgi:hypothetical protein
MALSRQLDCSVTSMPSHAGDSAVEAMLVVARCWCWVMLAILLLWWLSRSAMSMLSHVGDGAAKSCWWRCCRCDLVVVRCKCRVMLVMVLPSHADDDDATTTWPWRNIDVVSCWWRWCWVHLVATWCLYRVMLEMILSRQLGCGATNDHANTTSSQICI